MISYRSETACRGPSLHASCWSGRSSKRSLSRADRSSHTAAARLLPGRGNGRHYTAWGREAGCRALWHPCVWLGGGGAARRVAKACQAGRCRQAREAPRALRAGCIEAGRDDGRSRLEIGPAGTIHFLRHRRFCRVGAGWSVCARGCRSPSPRFRNNNPLACPLLPTRPLRRSRSREAFPRMRSR